MRSHSRHKAWSYKVITDRKRLSGKMAGLAAILAAAVLMAGCSDKAASTGTDDVLESTVSGAEKTGAKLEGKSGSQNETGADTQTTSASGSEAASVQYLTASDTGTSDYDESQASKFEFSDSKITDKEGKYSGYETDGTTLKINEAGTYIVSGKCSDGCIIVKKSTEDVILVLDGLTLTNPDTAPICCNKSTKVTIIAAEGSENTLEDSAANNDETNTENIDAENAVIKCKDGSQVTICGTGAINIVANGKNGIKSCASTETEGEAWLAVKETEINVESAANDAIAAENALYIFSGDITVSADDDGIHSDSLLVVGQENAEGPALTVLESYEGLEGANIVVYSGDISIHSQDDLINAANSELERNYDFTVDIYGGDLVMHSDAGDGFDSNGSLTISGGSVTVFTASTADNQPLDAESSVVINGGMVVAAGGSSGMGTNISASQPYITFGSVTIGNGMGGHGGMGGQGGMGGGAKGIPSPDANNQTDGTDSEMPEMPEGVTFSADGEMPEMPEGATFSADGEMPEMPEGVTFSADEDMPEMSGGKAPGMWGSSDASGISITEGSTLEIKDSSGNVIYTGEALCTVKYIIFSSEELESGETYTLYVDGTQTTEAQAS